MTAAYLRRLLQHFGEGAQLRARVQNKYIRLLIVDQYDERWLATMPIDNLHAIEVNDFTRMEKET